MAVDSTAMTVTSASPDDPRRNDAPAIEQMDWYQQFDMPELSIKGRFDRTATFDKLYPKDMDGKTVLDIGTREGLHCFEAAKRGAKRAVGLDVNPEFVARARMLCKHLQLPCEFGQLDVDEQALSDQFDIVLCLNVLHHVRNPFLVLEQLIDATKERLVLEIAGVGTHEQKKLKLRWWKRLLFRGIQGLPVVFLNRNPLRRNRQRFFLSVDAIHCLLTEHRRVFSRVEIFPSGFKDRHILVAHKRRINRLIVVTGPTSAGKSTLMKRIITGKAPEVADRLGMDDVNSWEAMDIYDLGADSRDEINNVIIHYDFLSRLKVHCQDHQMIELLDVVRAAKEVKFVTIWTKPDELREQFEENEIKAYIRVRGKEPTSRKTIRLQKEYQDPNAIHQYYSTWFDFASRLGHEHVVLSQERAPQFLTVDEWRRKTER